jgi:hypothetical protein
LLEKVPEIHIEAKSANAKANKLRGEKQIEKKEKKNEKNEEYSS